MDELLRVPPSGTHKATVIFIHGLGQSNLTWKVDVVESLASKLPHVEWILPQATEKPVSLNDGRRRPSWFNISSLPPPEDEYDEMTISESLMIIDNLIRLQLLAGMDSRNVVLVGFSQGAALSLMLALTKTHKLGGVASLSGWIPHGARAYMQPMAADFPVFWGHGRADEEIPFEYAEEAISFLQRIGTRAPLLLKVYDDLDHSTNVNEVQDLATWLAEVTG